MGFDVVDRDHAMRLARSRAALRKLEEEGVVMGTHHWEGHATGDGDGEQHGVEAAAEEGGVTEYTVVFPPLRIEAEGGDEAVEAALALLETLKSGDGAQVLAHTDATLADALRGYADPDAYFAIAMLPDRPAGWFADDMGCCIGPHGDHDHRHGRAARKALGDEWWGTEPCEEMRAMMAKEES